MSENTPFVYPRAPKRYPKKDLHGRVRFLGISYKDFKRFQKFYVNVFGWDMFELPEAAGGKKPGGEEPAVLIATGPSQVDWEGIIPGHMNLMAHHAEGEQLDDMTLIMEIHMDEPIACSVNRAVEHGGSVVGEIPEEKDNWTNSVIIKDSFGNLLSLGRCPSSRTWDEAEAGYDKD